MPSDEERALIDRFGLYFEEAGGTATAGRLMGWLLICEPPQQSITELTEAVSASKASVSTEVRRLQQSGFVERVPQQGTRQHVYQIKSGGWTAIVLSRIRFLRQGSELGNEGLDLIGRGTERSRRLEEYQDFLSYAAKEIEAAVDRWRQRREGEGGAWSEGNT